MKPNITWVELAHFMDTEKLKRLMKTFPNSHFSYCTSS